MNCPSCTAANPEQARFCLNCGASLRLTCPNCQTELPANARFCFNCGQAMSAEQPAPAPPPPAAPPSPPSAAPLESRLQQFIPKELLSRLESAQTSSLVGERRVVTMLFCDVKGSTAVASQLDPEEWAEIINGAFEQMIRPIYRYEGTVARLMGDGLLAFFGAPIAHEDDPQRAVLAGLDIVAAINGYRQEVQTRWGVPLDVRIGINTGLVVVGAVGSDLRLEYTALGDAINLAARMEQTAEPGTVQIAEATYRLIAPLFDVAVIDGIEVKGRAELVRAYRVLGRKMEPGSLRGIAGLRAPLIGRQTEMDRLRQSLQELADGRGQIVSVMGEAGLGKSRLVAELRDEALDGPFRAIQWIEGRSLSYETGTPYAPWIGILTNCLDLLSGPEGEPTYQRLQQRLQLILGDEADSAAPFLATILGLDMRPEEAEPVSFMEPPLLRARTFGYVGQFIKQLTGRRPLVIYLDDLHWIDPTSLELLEQLLPLTDQAPLMFLVAFRPRRQEPSWRFHELAQRDFAHRYTALALRPLDEDEARQMVGALLAIEDLPAHVRQLILDKSEGTPFFLEEVIRALLDEGLVVRQNGRWQAARQIDQIAIPDTLVGVITARLDRLDEATRRVVQAAAILGREFHYDILADLFGDVPALEAGLTELQRRELLREKSRLPQRIYTFKHILTQEAAYNSSLLSARRDLHRRAAESLASRQPDRAAEIARHYLEARQTAAAIPYLVAAGERAAHNYATAEALEFFTQAIDLRTASPSLAPIRKAYEGLGNVLTFLNRIPEAVDTYQVMLQLAQAGQDKAMEVSALNKLGSVIALRLGQFPEAEQYLLRAEKLAHEQDDLPGIAEMSMVRCQMCTAMADFDGVIEHMDDVVQIADKMGVNEFKAMGLEHVASSKWFLTQYDEAWTLGQEALSLAREVGDRQHEAWLLTTTLPGCLVRNGETDQARALLAEGLQIARRIGSLMPQAYGSWLMALLALNEGDYETALKFANESVEAALPLEAFMPFIIVQPLGLLGSIYLDISPAFADKVIAIHQRALRLLETPGGAVGGGTVWTDLGWCALALGDLQLAQESFDKGLSNPSLFMNVERPRMQAGAGLLAAADGRLDDALQLVIGAMEYAEKRRMRQLYPLLALATGQVLAARGEADAALAELERAVLLGQELRQRPIIWQAHAHAARLLDGLGRDGEAAATRTAGRTIVDEIAAMFTQAELRDAFLATAGRALSAGAEITPPEE